MCILVCFTLPVPPAMLCRLQEHGIWEENPIHVEDHGLLAVRHVSAARWNPPEEALLNASQPLLGLQTH